MIIKVDVTQKEIKYARITVAAVVVLSIFGASYFYLSPNKMRQVVVQTTATEGAPDNTVAPKVTPLKAVASGSPATPSPAPSPTPSPSPAVKATPTALPAPVPLPSPKVDSTPAPTANPLPTSASLPLVQPIAVAMTASQPQPATDPSAAKLDLINKRIDELQRSLDQVNDNITKLRFAQEDANTRAQKAAESSTHALQHVISVIEAKAADKPIVKSADQPKSAATAKPTPTQASTHTAASAALAPSTPAPRTAAPTASTSTNTKAPPSTFKEFLITSASEDYLVIAQGKSTKKVEVGGELPNGATFLSFDGKKIVTSIGTLTVVQ